MLACFRGKGGGLNGLINGFSGDGSAGTEGICESRSVTTLLRLDIVDDLAVSGRGGSGLLSDAAGSYIFSPKDSRIVRRLFLRLRVLRVLRADEGALAKRDIQRIGGSPSSSAGFGVLPRAGPYSSSEGRSGLPSSAPAMSSAMSLEMLSSTTSPAIPESCSLFRPKQHESFDATTNSRPRNFPARYRRTRMNMRTHKRAATSMLNVTMMIIVVPWIGDSLAPACRPESPDPGVVSPAVAVLAVELFVLIIRVDGLKDGGSTGPVARGGLESVIRARDAEELRVGMGTVMTPGCAVVDSACGTMVVPVASTRSLRPGVSG